MIVMNIYVSFEKIKITTDDNNSLLFIMRKLLIVILQVVY